MKNKSDIIIYTIIGSMLGAGLGMITCKKMNCKTSTVKKTAGKALRAAGSFIEHMSF